MAQVIIVFNQSGGVAKTTTTMNVGHCLAQLKQRVLLIDMDPQADLTAFMGFEPDEIDLTIYQSLVVPDEDDDGGDLVALPILHDSHGMDLVPSNIELSAAESQLITGIDPLAGVRLRNAIAPVRDQYDFILIDCPPSLGILSTVSLIAADLVLIPIKTEFKSRRGTNQLLKTIAKIQKRFNKSLRIAGFVPTIYRAGIKQHERSLKTMQEQLSLKAPVFSPIPQRTDFSDASEMRQPLASYNPGSDALVPLREIAKALVAAEVLNVLASV